MIVDHVSANPDVSGCDPIPVSQNHISICKPASKKAPVYVMISGLIRHHLLQENKLRRKKGNAKALLPPQTVVIGLVKHNNKVLMVRRRQMIDRLTWQFVAGRLRVYQEEPAECIVREIREETGITVRAGILLGTTSDEHAPYERIYFSCEYLYGEVTNTDTLENTDVAWVEISDVERYVTTPISQIAKQYLGLAPGEA
jgi:ADP-ribose pyrophosphatase YjhB (NUDIX family)